MTLDVAVRHQQGNFTLDATFHSSGRLTALFGPSGAGKTTLVKAIAGLIRPQQGKIVINGRALVDTTRQIFVPRHRRRIGIVFQEGRLFPHLNVRHNLLFGRWFAPRSEHASNLDHVGDLLGIRHLLDRKPANLSGGEKQRVAIGRALLADPQILLMDEPLASLDEGRKAEIFPYIERLRDETRLPIVLVSHSVAEISRLATSIVVLSEGRVAASGPASDIMRSPELFPKLGPAEVGAIIDTRVLEHDAAYALTTLQTRGGILTVPGVDLPLGAELRVRLRARDIILSVERPRGLSALNILPGMIVSLVPADASSFDVTLDSGGDLIIAHLTRKSVEQLGLDPGQHVHAIIKSIAFDQEAIGRAPPLNHIRDA